MPASTSGSSGLSDFSTQASQAIQKQNVRIISSGSTDTVGIGNDQYISWNSATASGKTENISAGSYAGQVIHIKDVAQTSGTYNITITGINGVTVDGGSTFAIATNGASISLKWDGTSNWMVF